MSISSSRAGARLAAVCLLIAGVLATALVGHAAASATAPATRVRTTERRTVASMARADGVVRGHYPSTPTELFVDGRTVLAFPPIANAEPHAPSVVYLHGIHGRPENGCPWMRSGASELGWLLCPEATAHEPSGTASWSGDAFAHAAVVTRALRAAEAVGASSQPGVAVGFSQGGYVAVDLATRGLARFRGLVLIAAPGATPAGPRLRAAGVERVVLASGTLDAAHAPLIDEANRLAHEGVDARFVDLGRVGHTYVADDAQTLRAAIAWAGGSSAPDAH